MKKKISSLIYIVLFSLVSVAQQVPRELVVVEIGTGTWCQFCPGAAMGADDLIANGYQVAIIENHNGDSYANTYSNARNSYYGVPGFPTAYFDGLNAVVGGSNTQSMFPQYSAKVNQRLPVLSSFTIDVEGTHTCLTDFTAHITVNKVAANSSTNLRLHTVVTESHIEEYWQGMDEVNWVCRLMAPNQSGTVVSFTSGDTQEFDIQFTVDPGWVLAECEVVVFLQDQSTKEIFQGTKLPLLDFLPEYNFDASVKQLFDLPVASCSGTFQPKLNLHNTGAVTMNTVDIFYQVNNDTPQSFAWSGNLDYLGEEIVALPPITFTGEEENELVVYTSNPNGNNDECPSNDNQTIVIPEAMHTPNTVKLILRTDINPGETTWEIKNSAGTVLFQGGPYSTSGQMVQETFDITEEDCFTFTINDAGGDGFANPGFYMLYYGSNTMISQGDAFGSNDIVDFNTTDVVGIDDNKDLTSVVVYPNPLIDKSSVVITLEQPVPVSLKVFAVTGQLMVDSDEGILETGQHGIMLDGTSWKQGLYLYRVTAGDKIFTGKLTVR
jgi:hypothetical protein